MCHVYTPECTSSLPLAVAVAVAVAELIHPSWGSSTLSMHICRTSIPNNYRYVTRHATIIKHFQCKRCNCFNGAKFKSGGGAPDPI